MTLALLIDAEGDVIDAITDLAAQDLGYADVFEMLDEIERRGDPVEWELVAA